MSLSPIAPRLITISQVRNLSQEDAARALPVRLTGVITAFSGWKNSFFLQDSSAGISVDRTDKADVYVGDRVELTGTSGAGLFAPIVLASYMRVVGHSLPPIPHRVSYEETMGGVQDSQWIELEGVVHSAGLERIDDHTVLVLRLTLGAGSVKVMVRDFTGIEFLHLVDSSVRLRGVCASSFNEKRQFVGLEMYVPSKRFLEVLVTANRDPFAIPPTPIRNTLQFGQVPRRVNVTGTSTYQVPGHSLYLQDGEDGIRVQTSSTEFIGAGRRVEAVGFPVMGEYAPILQDGFIHDLGPANPIEPLHIQAADVISPNQEFAHVPLDEQLVQLQGTVSESLIQGGQRVWILRQGREVFEAYLPVSATPNDAQNIVSGSVLLLTGICTVHADSDHVPISFGILLRSSRDIQVLERASWWTIHHTLMVLGVTAGVMGGVFLWVMILRKRVEQQTRTIRESESRFRDLAQNDVLTGLPNRLMLKERIAECLKTSDAQHKRATVLTIDIDRFKQINDTYGHLVGDECLIAVARRLRSIVRQTDTIARTGGEEFTLVVGGLTTPSNAKRISTQILDLFHAPVVLSNLAIKLSVSIGGAVYPDDGTDSEILRKRSDQALYEAKRSGRNRAVFATRELSATLEMETAIETALRECLRTGRFLLYYQPIFNASGAICRFEALLRTTDKWLNKMGPARFIPVAEACSLIIPIGLWVLEEACRRIAEWQAVGPFPFPIAVNISGQQLSHQGFVAEVLETLTRFQVAPGLLELELTETTAMTELAAVAEAMSRLAQSGVTFAIDDFGTGYSSLSRLHMLPIKALKIDRSFVMNLEKDNGFRTIIQAVIQMAGSLHLQVVAEGVETAEQFQILRDLGCDYFQGYLFACPLPAEAVTAALAENRARLLDEAS